jgi:hypothetical protein
LDTCAALATSATVTSRRREASVLMSAFRNGLLTPHVASITFLIIDVSPFSIVGIETGLSKGFR